VDEELEKTLLSKFPEVFGQYGDLPEGRRWGIDCGNGWFMLLSVLCYQLQGHVDRGGGPQVVARQIKQKMGMLMFLTSGADEYCKGAIEVVQLLSLKTCESCGNAGQIRRTPQGWNLVLCEPCNK